MGEERGCVRKLGKLLIGSNLFPIGEYKVHNQHCSLQHHTTSEHWYKNTILH